MDKIPAVAIWSQFAQEVGGTFTESPHSKPSMVMYIPVPGKVEFKFQNWDIVLDTLASPPAPNNPPRTSTRFRALFNSHLDFRFKIYREVDSVFTTAVKFLRLLKDVEIGDPEFDKQFIMRGTDDEKVKRFFSDPGYKALFQPLPSMASLQVFDDDSNIFKRKLPDSVDILRLGVNGVVEDIELLRAMKLLFESTLTRLVELREADGRKPDATLPE